MRYLKLWLVLAKNSLIREIQFKGNFIANIFVEITWTLVTFFTFELLFFQTQTISGWTKGEVFLLYAMFRISSATVSFFTRKNFMRLSSIVNSGEFDFFLTKPVNTLFLTSFRLTSFDRISQLLAGFIFFYYANTLSDFNWNPVKLTLLISLIFLGAIIRYSTTLIINTPVFWLQKLENISALEFTFFSTARFPRNTFPPILRGFLTFVLPIMFVAAIPAEIITGRSSQSLFLLVIAAAVFFLFIGYRFFNFALRHYSSASS